MLRFESGTATQTGRRKRQDFSPPPDQIIVFPPYVSEVEVDIPINNDDAVEGEESFRIILEAIDGNVVPGSVVATVTILDDDCK